MRIFVSNYNGLWNNGFKLTQKIHKINQWKGIFSRSPPLTKPAPRGDIESLHANDIKNKTSTYTLKYIPILIKSFLGQVRFFKINTKFQIFIHDGLQQLLGVTGPHLASLDDFIEDFQSSTWLWDINKFWKKNYRLLSN